MGQRIPYRNMIHEEPLIKIICKETSANWIDGLTCPDMFCVFIFSTSWACCCITLFPYLHKWIICRLSSCFFWFEQTLRCESDYSNKFSKSFVSSLRLWLFTSKELLYSKGSPLLIVSASLRQLSFSEKWTPSLFLIQ